MTVKIDAMMNDYQNRLSNGGKDVSHEWNRKSQTLKKATLCHTGTNGYAVYYNYFFDCGLVIEAVYHNEHMVNYTTHEYYTE